MPDEIIPAALPPKTTSKTPVTARWFVSIPGCELGRLCIKGKDEADAEAKYRSITSMIGGKPTIEKAT